MADQELISVLPAELEASGVSVHSLVDLATIWAVQKERFAWLLGAGVSASAGVPLASSIRDRLLVARYAAEQGLVRQDVELADQMFLERVHRYYDGMNGMPPLGSDGDYSAAFELCLPEAGARKAYLAEAMGGASPGFGQRVLGGLIASGACDLVITTNFDRLIERGVLEAQRTGIDLTGEHTRELNVAGLDSQARAVTALQQREWPLVVKLHGDFREKRLMNTDAELQEQDATLRRFVVDVSRQFGLVVSGYSGRDRSVMRMLEETATVPDAWPHGLWWCVRPGSELPPAVVALLKLASANKVPTHVVVANNFDETMTALSRQATVDAPMRRFFDALHPKPRVAPAALPTPSRQWPVLRFNALPVLDATVEATRVSLSSDWTRRHVHRALRPRTEWPVVVQGPGEVLCLARPEDAMTALKLYASDEQLPDPLSATSSRIDLVGPAIPFHHRKLLIQLIAHALQQVRPVWVTSDRHGNVDVVVSVETSRDAPDYLQMRQALRDAHDGDLSGRLAAKYGRSRDGRDRRWAEKIELSYDFRANRPWLLFTPFTWLSPLSRPENGRQENVDEFDPANPWRAERWTQRRFNERWAAIIKAWTDLIAPTPVTDLVVPGPSEGASAGTVRIGRTNAYSRPA